MINTREIRDKLLTTDVKDHIIHSLCDELDRLRERLTFVEGRCKSQEDKASKYLGEIKQLGIQLVKAPQVKDTEWEYKKHRIFLETDDERDVADFRKCAHDALWGSWGFPTYREPETQQSAFKYRKKSVVVEAFQMTEEMRNRQPAWPEWLREAFTIFPKYHTEGRFWCDYDDNGRLYVGVMGGHAEVSFGDWIVRGADGELYPCNPITFKAMYDPA